MTISSGIRSGLLSGIRSGLNPSKGAASTTTLTVDLADSADPVITGGDAFALTAVVQNTGAVDATSVSLQVTLDSSLTYVSASGSGWSISVVGQVVTATLATLVAGGTANTVTVNVTTGTSAITASTSASVSASNAPVPGTDTEATTVALVSKDTTSGKYVPASSAEFTSFRSRKSLSVAVPNYLHLLQEASGNLADSIGSLTLTALLGPGYQQAVTGWTRKGVKGDGATSQQRFMATTGPNPSTTSVARFAFVQFNTLDATKRQIMGCGAADDVSVDAYLSSGNNRLRYRQGLNISDTEAATNYTGVHPVLLLLDLTNSRARLYTDLEKLSPTFGAASNATNYSIGALSTGSFANVTVAYECGWQGANAEIADADVKAFFQALGYSITWS